MATSLKNLSDYDPEKVPDCTGLTFGIVVSEWNESVTASLAQGAYDTLIRHGALPEHITVHTVPGSFELPLGGQLIQDSKDPDAIILIGCVIQGETRHFDFICDSVANGCMTLGLKYSKPFIFGVLTTNNLQQAVDRSGGIHGNKGVEAALTAIRMVTLKRGLQ